ncbi:MAG: YfjI family protein [Sandaracinaceae bacterium]|nr:YfjI family protein [Sandaracinaceae bacterium]
MTICVAVQPAVLREAFGNRVARDRGLFDRFLYSLPPSNVGYRDLRGLPPEVPPEVAGRWDVRLRGLANAMLEAGEPLELPLSPAAREAFQRWRAELEPRQRTTGDLACVAGWAAKLSGHVLRLAGLMHVADPSAGAEVSVEALGRALVLADYFTAHAMIAFDVMGDDETASDARRVLTWVRAAGRATFTQTEVTRAFGGRIAAEPLVAVCEDLARRGYLRKRSERTGGRPATVYDVRPELLGGDPSFSSFGGNSDPKIEFSLSLSTDPTYLAPEPPISPI